MYFSPPMLFIIPLGIIAQVRAQLLYRAKGQLFDESKELS